MTQYSKINSHTKQTIIECNTLNGSGQCRVNVLVEALSTIPGQRYY